jgi:hypothetical protein
VKDLYLTFRHFHTDQTIAGIEVEIKMMSFVSGDNTFPSKTESEVPTIAPSAVTRHVSAHQTWTATHQVTSEPRSAMSPIGFTFERF